mmetsp:Transcript_8633/g.13228  ORF Transcript_8633/g.13228 Transcript_8633/m.13228 type:complete len:203 (+) Transcript_8633:3215-3823(+)
MLTSVEFVKGLTLTSPEDASPFITRSSCVSATSSSSSVFMDIGSPPSNVVTTWTTLVWLSVAFIASLVWSSLVDKGSSSSSVTSSVVVCKSVAFAPISTTLAFILAASSSATSAAAAAAACSASSRSRCSFISCSFCNFSASRRFNSSTEYPRTGSNDSLMSPSRIPCDGNGDSINPFNHRTLPALVSAIKVSTQSGSSPLP